MDEREGIDRSLNEATVPVVRGLEPFEAFYRREYDRSVRLAYVLSGSRWASEDMAQDAFIEAHRRWETIGLYENPGAWVRRVIANRSVSAYRKRLAEAKALVKLAAGARSPIPDLNAETEEVWEAVRRLPKRQAQVTALTYLDGLSLEQVAAVLEISIPTVGTHLQRARKGLARMLGLAVETHS